MKYIYLPKQYELVVGDKFELFYRGIIRLFNPYQYYILVRCLKGNPYPRYFTYTPKAEDEGTYELTVSLIDNNGEIIETGSTNLVVVKPEKPTTPRVVLCIGDSITFNGVWPSEGYRRVTKKDGSPQGLGFENSLQMIGTCQKSLGDDIVGYEGYGSWVWRSYCTTDVVSADSCVWVKAKHHLNEHDQHSVWQNHQALWILESIEEDQLKFKRGPNNRSVTPIIDNTFTHVDHAMHCDDIVITKHWFEKGNPFWNSKTSHIDFKDYVAKNHFPDPDLVYILLTWNGLYIPYNTNFDHHIVYAKQLLDQLHHDFPKCKVGILGVQICSVNGGIAHDYGATSYYSDTFGTISTAFNYNEALEQMCLEDPYNTYCKYIDTKGQFDSENNMPSVDTPVNARSQKTEKIGMNGVHPAMDGYLQIGDVFYRALIHDLKNK